VANETQILASAVVDLLHYSHIPSFPYSVTRVSHHSIDGRGRAGSGGCDYAKQTQFPDGPIEANCWSGKRLGEKVRAMRLRKQSQFVDFGGHHTNWEACFRRELEAGGGSGEGGC